MPFTGCHPVDCNFHQPKKKKKENIIKLNPNKMKRVKTLPKAIVGEKIREASKMITLWV